MTQVVKSKFVDRGPINELDDKIQKLYAIIVGDKKANPQIKTAKEELHELLIQDQEQLMNDSLKRMDMNFKKLLDPDEVLTETLESQRSIFNIFFRGTWSRFIKEDII